MPRPVVSKWRKRFFRERLDGLEDRSRRGRPPVFPPRVVAEVKALASELPAKLGLPLSRFSRSELRRQVLAAGIVADISGVTIWRWLHEDTVRSWTRRSWIFPRDPEFATKAGRVLDLYHRRWRDRALKAGEFRHSADEKTQIPIRSTCHPILPPAPGRSIRVGTNTGAMASAPTSAGLGRAPGPALRRGRQQDLHRRLRRPRRAGDGPRTLSFGQTRLLGRRQRHDPSRPAWPSTGSRRSSTHPGASAQAIKLAQPDRDLLLDPPTRSPHARSLHFPGRSRQAYPWLPGPLPAHRLPLRMDLHAPRSGHGSYPTATKILPVGSAMWPNGREQT